MTSEQFNELIEVIELLRADSSILHYIYQFFITFIATGISGFIAYKIAKYQVNKSVEQQEDYRIKEIENQKLFLFNQIKLKCSEAVLSSVSTATNDGLNMVRLGIKRDSSLLEGTITEIHEMNAEIQAHYDSIQDFINEIYTFGVLFEVELEKLCYRELHKVAKELMDKSIPDDNVLDRNCLTTLGDEITRYIGECHFIVKKAQLELIDSMKPLDD